MRKRQRRASRAEMETRISEQQRKIKFLANRNFELKKWAVAQFVKPDLSARKTGELIENSKSQLGQDIFALYSREHTSPGFFVEFGATDGIGHSNTWLLEHFLGWRGILAEPNRLFYSQLVQNRPNAFLSNKLVWKESGDFLEFSDAGAMSTLSRHLESDHHTRQVRGTYEVETISLSDLLLQGGAPSRVDFLSIDTEGSELEILQEFDFARWDIRLIAVEHNYGPQAPFLLDLMADAGYQRVMEEISGQDYWCVKT